MFQKLKEKVNSFIERVKDFFKRSVTILLARVELITGFITSVVGVMDWSPLLTLNVDTGLTWKQVTVLGLVMMIKGVVTELARRRSLNS